MSSASAGELIEGVMVSFSMNFTSYSGSS